MSGQVNGDGNYNEEDSLSQLQLLSQSQPQPMSRGLSGEVPTGLGVFPPSASGNVVFPPTSSGLGVIPPTSASLGPQPFGSGLGGLSVTSAPPAPVFQGSQPRQSGGLFPGLAAPAPGGLSAPASSSSRTQPQGDQVSGPAVGGGLSSSTMTSGSSGGGLQQSFMSLGANSFQPQSQGVPASQPQPGQGLIPQFQSHLLGQQPTGLFGHVGQHPGAPSLQAPASGPALQLQSQAPHLLHDQGAHWQRTPASGPPPGFLHQVRQEPQPAPAAQAWQLGQQPPLTAFGQANPMFQPQQPSFQQPQASAASFQPQPGSSSQQQPSLAVPASSSSQNPPAESMMQKAAALINMLLSTGSYDRAEAAQTAMDWLHKQSLGQQQLGSPDVLQMVRSSQRTAEALAESVAASAKSQAEASVDALTHQEPDMNLAANQAKGTFNVLDNSTDLFQWDLRLALKAPNAVPSSYWGGLPGHGAQKAEPRRASSLVMTHLMGTCQVNPNAILLTHDRANPLCYHYFLSRNAQVNC